MFSCEAINLEKEQPQKTYMLRSGDCVLVLSKDELVYSIQKNSIRVSNILLEGRDIKVIKPQINYKTKCINKPNPEFLDKCYKEVLLQLRLRVGEHLYRFESHRGKSVYDIGVCYGGKVIKDIIRFRDLFIDFYNIDLGTWITYSYNALIFTNLPTMIYTLYWKLNEMSVAEISNC